MRRNLILILLRGFGTGFTPGIPGTAGSLLALLLVLPFWFFRKQIGVIPVTCSFFALSFVTGVLTWTGFRSYRDEWEEFDPSDIVLDEFAGTFFIAGATSFADPHVWMFIGFVLFRFFDMLKPFPVHQIEQTDRYAGLVLDDLMAAVMASLVTGAIWMVL